MGEHSLNAEFAYLPTKLVKGLLKQYLEILTRKMLLNHPWKALASRTSVSVCMNVLSSEIYRQSQ